MLPTELKPHFAYRARLSPDQKGMSAYSKLHDKVIIYLGLAPRIHGDAQRHTVAIMLPDGSTGEKFDVFQHVIHAL